MSSAKPLDETVPVATFPSRCSDLVDAVTHGRTARVVLIEGGRPVAALVPLDGVGDDLWGAMRGTVEVVDGTDLTRGTGESWDADA